MIRAPGIYFGLLDSVYHASPWLGSTDIRRLLRSGADFWWHSWFNPAKPDDDPTAEQFFGRAVHQCILEGPEAFERTHAPAEYSGNIKAGIEERKTIVAAGKLPVKRADYDRIVLAGSMIRLNPSLAEAFSGGASEVSVFWEADGIPKKCRFDYLKVRAIGDLKSIRNSRGLDFIEACRRAIAEYRYEIQAEHYREGRMAMASLVAKGRVHGDHDSEWLKRVVATDAFAFVFVFYQATDAPITWGCSLSPGNPILDLGRRDIDRALDRYRTFMNRFGTENAWVLSEPISELDPSELPAWHWRTAA